MRKLVLLVSISVSMLATQAQTPASGYCGTQQTEADLVWLREFQAHNTPGEESRGGSTYYIPTKEHIVGNDEGTGYYNLNYMYQAFCELNERFAETGFIFYIFEDVNYIDNTDYYEHNFLDGGEMMDEYNVNNVLNVYFVSDPAGNCGYFSPSDDGVAVAKSCAMPNGTTITHEFGHFFSLPHTFYGWEWGTPDDEDQEWVNGANCNSSADGFCDTPPDYLPYRWNCPGPLQTDPFGDTFYADGSLYMSYSNDECTSRFSEEQMDAMRANLLGPRNNFLDWPDPAYAEITGTATLISPSDLAVDVYFNYATLEWTAVPGATEYHLQLAFSPSFSAIAADVITTETTHTFTDLAGDKKYYWRVRPLAPANTCAEPSLARSFTTGNMEWSDVLESNVFNSISVYPNPASVASTVTVNYNLSAASEVMFGWYDLTGKLLAEELINSNSGSNVLSLPTPQAASGIYMLRVQVGNHTETIAISLGE